MDAAAGAVCVSLHSAAIGMQAPGRCEDSLEPLQVQLVPPCLPLPWRRRFAPRPPVQFMKNVISRASTEDAAGGVDGVRYCGAWRVYR